MKQSKYALGRQLRPTIAPLTAAIGLALGASNLQAATITVTTLADGSVPGECTLRDALHSANTDSSTTACAVGSGPDEIVFQGGLVGTLTLSGGPLLIGSELSIQGPGEALLTIDGNGLDRVFAAQATPSASIDGLTLSNGYTNEVYGGSALVALNATLSLSNCTISGNASGMDALGGAITAYQSELSIDACTISNNTVAGGILRGSPPTAFGAGVLAVGSSLTIGNSTFSSNLSDQYGGALNSVGSLVDISNSSFTGNQALIGGAIVLGGYSLATVTDSQISGNQAQAGGGLILGGQSEADLTRVEVTNNYAVETGGGVQVGFGYVPAMPLSAPAGGNTLFGGGPTAELTGPGTLTVVDSTIGENGTTRTGGGLAAKYDSTVELSSTQVALNYALPGIVPRLGDALPAGRGAYQGVGGGLSAIEGAYVQAAYVDVGYNDAAYGGGAAAFQNGSLALLDSLISGNQAGVGGGLLGGFFNPPPAAGSDPIVRSRGAAPYNGAIGVIYSEVSGNTANNGGGVSSIFDGLAVVKYSEVRNNTANQWGGGLLSYQSYLATVSSQVVENTAERGGGLFHNGASGGAVVSRSEVIGNSASVAGGLYLAGSSAELKYSTVADNTALTIGGVVAYSPGAPDGIVIVNSTVSGNNAEIVGGVYAVGATLDFTTVSHNVSTGAPTPRLGPGGEPMGTGEIPGGAFLLQNVISSNSIFSDNTSPGGTIDLNVLAAAAGITIEHSLIETPGAEVVPGIGTLTGLDPELGPLTDNGGPTRTRALSATSPALDAGNPVTTVEFDQRGEPFPRVFGGRADMGAFELFFDEVFQDRFEQP
ncbi:CSLREA domain-containing protein [Wenzhouxiangella marina]|uniref:Right handed beta helix domain-containing protein n=1 Tax=Wenzhouxiangella marina TaxID=1579979 RepID=A0A0K0XS73_9GAMM|nr:CSLREA domain-containing protein [Wenzhouxiangella marina]AKS40564.1 hypothetical protein WM2015_175 [Wenzhouxiangella marina]MBB6088332.1 hypothetical protein [Wenzhouxiangella marina]